MTSASISRSVPERTSWQLIGDFFEQRLILWSPSTQAKKANTVLGQQHLTTDQTSRPLIVDGEVMAEDRDRARLRGAPDIDQTSTWIVGRMVLQVEGPIGGERISLWRSVPTLACAMPMGGYVTNRLRLKHRQRFVLKARPHFRLPLSVVAFDGGLKPLFRGGYKYRYDPQAEAESHDPTDNIGVLMGPLKDRAIIKLRVGRPPPGFPVFYQREEDGFGRDRGRLGPGDDQAAMQRHPIKEP